MSEIKRVTEGERRETQRTGVGKGDDGIEKKRGC